MSKIQSHFGKVDLLQDLIDKNHKNNYIRTPSRGDATPEQPLAFLHPDEKAFYFLKTRASHTAAKDGFIAASATVYPHKKGENLRFGDAATLHLLQVSVAERYARKGIATDLLKSVFSLAAKTGAVITLGHFEKESGAYLAPVLPKIHAAFPDVGVVYYNMNEPITGHKPYQLVSGDRGQPVPQLP